MTNIVALHRRAVDHVLPIVGPITAADLHRETPCAGWDLRALLEHMIGQDHGFALAATTPPGVDLQPEAFAARSVGADPVGLHRDGLQAVCVAFAAADPSREVHLADLGLRLPLAIAIGFHLVDTLVHGWDVARALGAEVAYDAEVVAVALDVAERVPGGDYRTTPGASFGPALPVAPDDDAWTRTLALLGRDPDPARRSNPRRG